MRKETAAHHCAYVKLAHRQDVRQQLKGERQNKDETKWWVELFQVDHFPLICSGRKHFCRKELNCCCFDGTC